MILNHTHFDEDERDREPVDLSPRTDNGTPEAQTF